MDTPRRHKKPLLHTLPLSLLLIPPIILALLTAYTLFLHSDTNLYLLYSQCHAHSRLPSISHFPLLGPPICFLVSFFQHSASSLRSTSLLSTIFSFLSGLLTISTIESSRICNAPNILIAYPTGPWLVFDFLGGAFVWELIILPAFFHRSKEIITTSSSQNPPENGQSQERHLTNPTEILAIPIAITLGFILPSILFLTLNTPVTIMIWLFFPLWVSLIRQTLRKLFGHLLAQNERWQDTLHLESNKLFTAGMYLLPILCSVLSHVFMIWVLATQPDDRKEMTRSAIKFIVIDTFFVGLTVLYWILVEAGWQVALVMVITSVILGPGAGVCVGWIYREQHVNLGWNSVTFVAVGARRPSDDESHDSEETPLLR
ncbi:hypothetical protein QBC38DRAFT_469947 [Podospora fimiseda]|uniref:Corticosteroid-binding protein n=1 Tax=Podospora fimiseda TaxID=252190 RepID=A0AAN7BVM9_9PEZI|nr:hypothetical protein QBC38DRAFT_469947 [Podospora fimiseda]